MYISPARRSIKRYSWQRIPHKLLLALIITKLFNEKQVTSKGHQNFRFL